MPSKSFSPLNIQFLKYAVEVAEQKSISKAARNLFMGQPNLSRSIKELEDELGIIIFERTSKGINPTPDGEEFLQYAKRILSQIDEVEEIYKVGKKKKTQFSVSVPRAGYIAYAFAELAKKIDISNPAEIFYKEFFCGFKILYIHCDMFKFHSFSSFK